MSGILGIVDWRGRPVEDGSLERMADAAAHRGPDGRGFWREGSVGFGFLNLALTPGSPATPAPTVRDHVVVAADARLDNLDELLPFLRSKGELRTDSPGDAEVILAAYRVWGLDCPVHLIGDFSFALWDGREERLFAARDPMGTRPFYYRTEAGGRFLFASEAKQILALPDVPMRIHERALLAHVAGPYGRPEWSFFEGIQQLPPGHSLTAGRSGGRTRRFWQVDPELRIRYRREADYGEHFRALFQDAVASRLRSHRPVGLLLSGGVDSGSIAAMGGWLMEKGEVSPPALRAYCWAFRELTDGDEREVSDVIVTRYGLDQTDIPADDGWALQGYPNHAPDRDDPHLWPYQPLMDRSMDQAKKEGMGSLLTGDRGDEVVGDWVWDHPGMFLGGRWLLLRKELEALGEPGWSGLKRRVLRPLLTGAGARGQSLPLPPWVPSRLASEYGLQELIRASPGAGLFRDPFRQMRYERIFSFPGMRIALANERRRARRGLGFADPWSDVRLIRFVLALPQWRVNRVTEPKRIARAGLRGIMPEAVRMRTGKTIPNGLFDRGFKDRGLPAVRDLLRDSMLEEMGLLEGADLREAFEGWVAGGTLRHDFWWPLSAEFWLRTHWR